MKKVVLSLAVLCSVALVSCGGKKAEATDSAVDTTAAIEEVVVAEDSNAAGDTTVVAAVETEAPADSAK